MLFRLAIIATAIVILASADTLTLRSGRVVSGQYLGGDAQHVRMAVGDHVDTFDIADVGDLQFTADAARSSRPLPAVPPGEAGGQNQGFAQQAPPPPPAPDQAGGQNQGFAQQAPPPASVSGIQVPSGTPITVRMIDKVDSNDARLGQTFRAGVDEPVIVNGQTGIPRRAGALVKLVQDRQSGAFEGRTVLTLALTDITINGQTIDTTTGNVSQTSSSRGARSAKVVGGATVLGTIIGALAGGGRGAAIGAVSGAAVGGGAQIITKRQVVKISSETRLTFTLQQPIQF
ncbi:MAG: hypothetical protein JOZ32_05035 [Bryobacterales bacterium]|nr:hypothetical protein [Bryobacterales bacterium]